jgi:hypothetical protein
MTIRRTRAGWLFAAASVASLASLHGCGGSDDAVPAPTPAPSPATPGASMMTTLTSDMTLGLTLLGGLEGGAVVTMTGGSPLAPNITATADNGAGVPPNTFTYRGTYDGNGNGQDETTLDLRTTFVNSPTDFIAGFTGGQTAGTVDINILGVMHVYHGDIALTLGMAQHQLSGSGTFNNPLSGTTTSMSVSASDPLTIKLADGSATAQPNACAHSFNGPVQVSVAGPAGTLASQWRFASSSTTVQVTGATFTPPGGTATPLPDAAVDLGCTGNNSLSDWNGRFRIQWACLPAEWGEFNTTIAVKNATTVTMIDDGDTAADAYDAAMIGTSARAIRGFFISGPMGSRYREDFNWTLNRDGSGFTQTSRYVYFEGGQSGTGGICAARATRIS